MSHIETALVVEGGALRSVFSAGILDGFLDQGFDPFDLHIGVSAGATNLAFYRAGDRGKAREIFLDIIRSNRFVNYRRFLTGGHLLDLDWLFGSYFSEDMLDVYKAFDTSRPFYIAVTDVKTGKPVYLTPTVSNYLDIFKATTALPMIYRQFPRVDETELADGGVADPIPLAKAIELGAKKIIVIRARHFDYMKKDTVGHKVIRWKSRKNPALVEVMRERVRMHRDTIHLMRNPPEDVQVIEVCPPSSFDIGRFSRNTRRLEQGYEAGLEQAGGVIERFSNL